MVLLSNCEKIIDHRLNISLPQKILIITVFMFVYCSWDDKKFMLLRRCNTNYTHFTFSRVNVICNFWATSLVLLRLIVLRIQLKMDIVIFYTAFFLPSKNI